jgi:hypothetical protein
VNCRRPTPGYNTVLENLTRILRLRLGNAALQGPKPHPLAFHPILLCRWCSPLRLRRGSVVKVLLCGGGLEQASLLLSSLTLLLIFPPTDKARTMLARFHALIRTAAFAGPLALLLISTVAVAEQQSVAGKDGADQEGFVAIFDGKSLDGWKKSEENPDSLRVEDGMIVIDGPRAHLFYDGELAPLKNFHFVAEVKTTPGSNSGIYFHTRYQESGWPKHGYECQVNISHSDPKKTSGLYGVKDVADPAVKDNEWYTQEIIVEGRRIRLILNGETMVDYTEPENKQAESRDFERRLSEGTFALQAHDPNSKVYFRNLRVKPLD